MTLVEWLTTPGRITLPSGSFTSRQTCHSCSWRTLAASNEYAPALTSSMTSTMSAIGMSVGVRAVPAAPAQVEADALGRAGRGSRG